MVREGYKETELGEIPEDWDVYTLGEGGSFRLETGGTPSTENSRYWGGDIPWLKSGEVNNKKIVRTEQFITKSGYNSSNAKILPKLTILIALAGQGKTRGTIAITNIELTTNQSVAGIICNNNKVSPPFLYQYLDSKYEELRSSSLGAGRAGLSLKVLREFNVIIPSLPEQHRIATVLSTIDACIEKTEALIAKLKSVKAGLMQDLLTRGIDDEGRIRTESTHEFKDTEIGRVPVEWDVKRAGSLFIDMIEKPPKCHKLEKFSLTIEEGLIPKPERYNRDFLIKRGDEEAFKIVIIGDIVYNPMNLRFGAIAIWGEKKSILVSTYYNVLRTEFSENNPFFYYALFSTKKYKYIFESIASGTLIEKKRVHWSNFSDLLLPNPSVREQNQIASALNSINKKILREELFRNKFISQKKGLMADLLTGMVRVPVTIVPPT